MRQDSIKVLKLLENGRIDLGDALLLLAALTGRSVSPDGVSRRREDPRVNRNYVRFLLQQV